MDERRRMMAASAWRMSLVLAAVVSLGAGAAAETIDRVLAVVAGQVVMLSDVTAARELALVPASGAADPIRAALSALIDRELMLVEVNRYAPPEPSADAVDSELAAVRARFSTGEAFDAALARSGIDIAHLRQTLREDLRIRAYLNQRFGSDERQSAVEDWIAALRRRATVVDLYLPVSSP